MEHQGKNHSVTSDYVPLTETVQLWPGGGGGLTLGRSSRPTESCQPWINKPQTALGCLIGKVPFK